MSFDKTNSLGNVNSCINKSTFYSQIVNGFTLDMTAPATLTVSNVVTCMSTLDVSGNSRLNGNVNIGGNLSVSGNTVLGNASSDTVGFYGSSGTSRQSTLATYTLTGIGNTSSGDRSSEITTNLNAIKSILDDIKAKLTALNLTA